MKMLRHFAVLALFLCAAPALAQQVQNHAVPIGRGAGVTGFGAAAPGVAGQPFVSQGASVDPSFGTIGNAGFTVGPANTAKGSLDGVNVTDIPLPSCTSVNSAWRYTSGTGINCAPISVTTGFDTPINLGLSVSAAGGNLTINVTQRDGTAPSASGPVLVPFRNLTATDGRVTYSTIASALSLVIPSPATLGTSSGNIPFRLWFFLTANGGTPSIGVATCSNATAIFPCASWENTLKTTVAMGAGATSAGVLYASAAVTLDAVRIVGFCDFGSGLGTAGTWASSCTALQVMNPSVKKPGDVIQTVAPSFGTLAVVTNATAGTPVSSNVTATIALSSPINLVRYSAAVTSANVTGSNGVALQMFRGATAIGATLKTLSASANFPGSTTHFGVDAPGISSSTYVIKFFPVNGSTTASVPAVNTDSATEVLEEIMGSLPEPANDNLHPGLFARTG